MAQENQLAYLNDETRLDVYKTIISGCTHVWSKNTLQNGQTIMRKRRNPDGTITEVPEVQEQRLQPILDTFITLADQDPVFLAHFNSWAITKSDGKDLKVLSTFINSLSDADGTPFSEGSDYKKPNYRRVAQAAVLTMDPKLVSRLITIANLKMPLGARYKEGTHFARSLKNACKKYIRFREQNPKALEGIKKAAFTKIMLNMYRALHIAPSDEAVAVFGWDQKDGRVAEKSEIFNFKGLSDLAIAEKIREEKLKPQGVLGALNKKISPVIAAAVLEQCSGDQAVIYRELFDKEGLLKDKEIMEVFTEKIKTAKTALDRVDKITTEVDADVSKELKKARADKRKEIVGDLGKVFVHIDASPSMMHAINFAKERGSIIAECIKNPEENFHWGLFDDDKRELDLPETFEKDAFMARLYGIHCGGHGTNCLSWYEDARKLNCEIDIYLTDEDHNTGVIRQIVENCDEKGLGRPKAAVVIMFPPGTITTRRERLSDSLEAVGIPVSRVDPNTLTESALVAQAVRDAMRGAMSIIDDIMGTPLLELPRWYESIKLK